jgi:carboxymethylenebutenolidase
MSQQDATYNSAAGPLAESTVIHTSSDGLDAEYTTVPAQGYDMPAYVARPSGGTHLPTVIVLPEAFGLHEHIADIARRFAHEGYLAIAPDLMRRHGDPESYPDVDSLVTQLLQRIPDEQVMLDIDATVAWARSQGGDPGRVGVTGFCWGGRWAWLYAARSEVGAAVAWYGILDGEGSGAYPDRTLFPQHPLDVAGQLRAPVLGLYGGQDDAIPLDTIERMQQHLADRSEADPDSEIVVFPSAGHAFFADYRETYHAPSAQEAWPRALAWLREHGV